MAHPRSGSLHQNLEQTKQLYIASYIVSTKFNLTLLNFVCYFTRMLQLSRVIGHRGVAGLAPENTLNAMQKAYELGVEWVEFDVMLTKNGEAIVIHDITLDRTTNGTGNVAEVNYEDIAKLDAGEWFAKEFSGAHVPTFSEILQFIKKLGIKINVEIKPTPGAEIKTAQKVLTLLEEHWPSNISPPLISSFSIASLLEVRRLNADVWIGLAIHGWQSNWQRAADEIDAQSIHAHYKMLNAKRIQEVKQTGRAVLAHTVNDSDIAKQLFEWGVTAIFSDFPNKIK